MRALTLQWERKQNCCLENLIGNSAEKGLERTVVSFVLARINVLFLCN
jgi:hypothetical protein